MGPVVLSANKPAALRDPSPEQKAPPARQQSAPRSRSASPSEQLQVSIPHNLGSNPTGETIQAEISQRPAVRSGEAVWQARITMPQAGTNPGGRQRTIDISAPPRKTKELAEEDAKQLTDASPQGAKAVRTLAN